MRLRLQEPPSSQAFHSADLHSLFPNHDDGLWDTREREINEGFWNSSLCKLGWQRWARCGHQHEYIVIRFKRTLHCLCVIMPLHFSLSCWQRLLGYSTSMVESFPALWQTWAHLIAAVYPTKAVLLELFIDLLTLCQKTNSARLKPRVSCFASRAVRTAVLHPSSCQSPRQYFRIIAFIVWCHLSSAACDWGW